MKVTKNTEFFVVIADSCEQRGAADALAKPTPGEAGNRAERFVASTSLPAFSLYRVTPTFRAV
jgi:hypothetical protein